MEPLYRDLLIAQERHDGRAVGRVLVLLYKKLVALLYARADLRIVRSRAYELVADGKIPSVRIGRSVRVNHRELERWLEGQRYADAPRK